MYAHIALDNPAAAEEFLDAVDALLNRLLQYPEIGSPIDLELSRLKDMRVLCVSKKFYRYLVFYRVANGDIHVVRVLHSSRNIESLFSEQLS